MASVHSLNKTVTKCLLCARYWLQRTVSHGARSLTGQHGPLSSKQIPPGYSRGCEGPLSPCLTPPYLPSSPLTKPTTTYRPSTWGSSSGRFWAALSQWPRGQCRSACKWDIQSKGDSGKPEKGKILTPNQGEISRSSSLYSSVPKKPLQQFSKDKLLNLLIGKSEKKTSQSHGQNFKTWAYLGRI